VAPSVGAHLQGKAVQVDPIKPKLKPPGTKHLKLKCDELLSSFAFRFNLRRYIKELMMDHDRFGLVRRCRSTLSKLPLKAPGIERLKLNCDEPLSSFGFNFKLCRYSLELPAAAYVRACLDCIAWEHDARHALAVTPQPAAAAAAAAADKSTPTPTPPGSALKTSPAAAAAAGSGRLRSMSLTMLSVIPHIVDPRSSSQMTSCDVACIIT